MLGQVQGGGEEAVCRFRPKGGLEALLRICQVAAFVSDLPEVVVQQCAGRVELGRGFEALFGPGQVPAPPPQKPYAESGARAAASVLRVCCHDQYKWTLAGGHG